ncbi:uncharacterized protein LOC129256321 isoform X2 [Lytechinus pictus]
MGSSILPLHQTACSTVCEALLDHNDPHSEDNRRTGRHLVEQLKSNVFAPISGDVLKMFVKRYPSCLTSDLLLLLAPPHLRVLDLTKCHNIGKSESDLQALRQAFSRCKHLQSLVLNEIRSEAHNTEALIEAIVDTAPQLTSVSMEHIPVIEDKHVQILLRGLPFLTSLNLSMCECITDDVFYLSQDQLSEIRPWKDNSFPGSHLASVDLSGCQNLTNTCIRHLLELCGPNLRNLNVSCTAMDFCLLWYLSGYSLSSTVQFVLQAKRNQDEPYTDVAFEELLETFNSLQRRLDEMKRGVLVDKLQGASSDVGAHVQNDSRETDFKKESSVNSETVSKEQVGGLGASAVECEDLVPGSSCPSSIANGTENTANTDWLEDEDLIASPQCEPLDAAGNSVVLSNSEFDQSGLASDLSNSFETRTDSNVDTKHGTSVCSNREVSIEIDSEESNGMVNKVNTSCNSKAGETVFPDPQTRNACDLFNASGSEQLHHVGDESELLVTADMNMNVTNPCDDSMQCQLCGRINRTCRLSKTGSASGILEQNKESVDYGLPIKLTDQVSIISDISASDPQDSKCDLDQNQRNVNSSILKHVESDSYSAMESRCDQCQDSTILVEEGHTNTQASQMIHAGYMHQDVLETLLLPSDKCYSERPRFLSCDEHICEKTGQSMLQDSDPSPGVELASACAFQLASATATYRAMETTSMSGDESLLENTSSVTKRNLTSPVEGTAVCCAIEMKESSSSSGNRSSSLDGSTTEPPVGMHSTSEMTVNDGTRTCWSTEPSDCLDSLLPAAMQNPIPRLFEPNIVSLDISFIGLNYAVHVVSSCLEDCFSVNHQVKELVLSQKALTDAMLEIISKNVKDLRNFKMYDCQEISNEGLASFLKGCPNLQYLDIQGPSHIGDQGVYPIFEHGENNKLSVIKLSETCITDITLHRIATTIGQKLQELVLLWCDDVTDAGLYKIAHHCPSLTTLLLRQRTMRSETLQAFVYNCPHLKDVGLSSISCITGELMESLASRLKRLQRLDVSWNFDLTNQAVSAILSSCPVLEELLLCGVRQITEKPFLSIIANYPKWKRCRLLIQLKMREQKLRRDTGFAQLSSDEEFEDLYVPHRSTSYAPSLQNLDLQYCDHVNDNRLQEIVAVCKGALNIINYYGEDIMPKLLHSV